MAHVILLVEDDTDNMDITTKRLKRKAFEVLQARDGQEGVDMARAEMPDLILMDIRLPVMSGIDAIRILKDDEGTKSIPIIALTGEAMEHQRREVLDAGSDDFHAKPMVFKRLLKQMDDLLSQRAES